MERTSLRSATQATDSTCVGCTAKSAATTALRPGAPVMRESTRNRSAAFAACRSTLTAWWAPGASPKSCTSSMCESHVSGCQLLAWKVVNAHARPAQPSPPCTTGFSVT